MRYKRWLPSKIWRTIFLAIFAALAFAVSAHRIFDVPKEDLIDFFLLSSLGLFLIIVTAFLLVAGIIVLKKVFK